MSNITRKDIIGWVVMLIIAIIGMVKINVVVTENKQLKEDKKEVNLYVKNLQQNNYYNTLPPDIKNGINKIAEVSGSTVAM